MFHIACRLFLPVSKNVTDTNENFTLEKILTPLDDLVVSHKEKWSYRDKSGASVQADAICVLSPCNWLHPADE